MAIARVGNFEDERLIALNDEDDWHDTGMRDALQAALEPGEVARASYNVSAHIWVEAVLTDRALLLVKGAVRARVHRHRLPVPLLRAPTELKESARVRTSLGDKTLWSSKLDPDCQFLFRSSYPAGSQSVTAPVVAASRPAESAPSPRKERVFSRRARWALSAAVAVALALVISAGMTLATPSPQAAAATTVERVVDGDTIEVNINGKVETVRLSAIDTPETKHPDKPVECLGPEAAARLETLLPPGTVVTLDVAERKRDRYGRLLATVWIGGWSSVSETLASEGLGVPYSDGSNGVAYARVQEAFELARQSKRGFFDPNRECTVPAQYAEALTQAQSVSPAQAGAIPQAAANVEQAGQQIESAAAFLAAIAAGETTLTWAAIPNGQLKSMKSTLRRAVKKARTTRADLRQHAADLSAAKERREDARRAREEDQRRAAEEERRLAAEAREQQSAIEVPPAPEPAAPDPWSVTAAPGPGWTNDTLSPGYTGCRQGYPGGRVNGVYWWNPISC